jgi:F1F0 ATPase subunit 2
MLVRLEMDEERMSIASFDAMPAWVEMLDLAAHLGAGLVLGSLYFRSLWWGVSRLAGRESPLAIIALLIGRFVLIGAVLTLASLEGALPLLTMALGVFAARFTVMHRIREAAP